MCTPDKDLAQCVRGRRVVQLDRRKDVITDEEAVRDRYGIGPRSIPDWLALVGDSADGFPGLQGWGKQSASKVLGLYEHLEAIPASASDWDPALRALRCAAPPSWPNGWRRTWTTRCCSATWRRCASTARCWRRWMTWCGGGPTPDFEDIARFLRDPALADRAASLGSGR